MLKRKKIIKVISWNLGKKKNYIWRKLGGKKNEDHEILFILLLFIFLVFLFV